MQPFDGSRVQMSDPSFSFARELMHTIQTIHNIINIPAQDAPFQLGSGLESKDPRLYGKKPDQDLNDPELLKLEMGPPINGPAMMGVWGRSNHEPTAGVDVVEPIDSDRSWLETAWRSVDLAAMASGAPPAWYKPFSEADERAREREAKRRPLSVTTSMMGKRTYTLDVVIPVHPKDRFIAKRSVELLKRHAGHGGQLGTIYVVSPASGEGGAPAETPAGTTWVDQARFPLDPTKMHREVYVQVRGWGVYCCDFQLLPITPSVSRSRKLPLSPAVSHSLQLV